MDATVGDGIESEACGGSFAYVWLSAVEELNCQSSLSSCLSLFTLFLLFSFWAKKSVKKGGGGRISTQCSSAAYGLCRETTKSENVFREIEIERKQMKQTNETQ